MSSITKHKLNLKVPWLWCLSLERWAGWNPTVWWSLPSSASHVPLSSKMVNERLVVFPSRVQVAAPLQTSQEV